MERIPEINLPTKISDLRYQCQVQKYYYKVCCEIKHE